MSLPGFRSIATKLVYLPSRSIVLWIGNVAEMKVTGIMYSVESSVRFDRNWCRATFNCVNKVKT